MNVTSDRVNLHAGSAAATGSLPANMVPHPREETFSVLVVDGHRAMREAIVDQLDEMGAGAVHVAASVAEARASLLATGPCDLAMLDLGLPDGSGIELVRELRQQGWPRVVVFASAADPDAVQAAFRAGAMAYLLKKPVSPAVAADARPSAAVIDSLLDRSTLGDPGVVALSSRADDYMIHKILARAQALEDRDDLGVTVPVSGRMLSQREVEVVQLVADGLSNKEISDALNLSALTVKSHLRRVGRKLDAYDRAQIVALCMKAGTIH